MACYGMKIKCTVRLTPMQEDRHGGDGDMRQPERDGDIAPPWKIEKTWKQHSGLPLSNR